jgi:glutathione synthase
MDLVVVMDPPSTVQVDADTSFALMEAAERRGHAVFHCLITDLYLRDGAAWARVRPATPRRTAAADGGEPIALGPPRDFDLRQAGAVLVRTDPPFDERYLWGTQILETLRGRTLVVNDPRGLREANEKLYACHFPDVMTDTLVTADKARIKAFVIEVGGRAVVKPLSGAGGAGVMQLLVGDPNFNAIVESATHDGRRVVMVQRYLPEVVRGDKRILLLDGDPLGAILRIPRADDLRSNIHVGGVVEKATLDEDDRRIVARLRERLRADGLYFVGLDVIGGRLTEVNVTSPTGIQQMSRFDGVDHAARVVEWLERCSRGSLPQEGARGGGVHSGARGSGTTGADAVGARRPR